MSKTSETVIFAVVGIIAVIGIVLGGMYMLRSFNAATLHTQIINPKNGIECVVVSAADSTSVDCWKAL